MALGKVARAETVTGRGFEARTVLEHARVGAAGPTPGAAWFGIDALNNPDGNWPRRGGAVPYATMDPDIMIPGLRAVLNPRASASERILGGVMLGMTALPAAGVAIRWVAVAVRASGALRAAGVVTRGGTVFWRGVAGGEFASARGREGNQSRACFLT